jgi:hypothetical protein
MAILFCSAYGGFSDDSYEEVRLLLTIVLGLPFFKMGIVFSIASSAKGGATFYCVAEAILMMGISIYFYAKPTYYSSYS